jgi:hypothetical protein
MEFVRKFLHAGIGIYYEFSNVLLISGISGTIPKYQKFLKLFKKICSHYGFAL